MVLHKLSKTLQQIQRDEKDQIEEILVTHKGLKEDIVEMATCVKEDLVTLAAL